MLLVCSWLICCFYFVYVYYRLLVHGLLCCEAPWWHCLLAGCLLFESVCRFLFYCGWYLGMSFLFGRSICFVGRGWVYWCGWFLWVWFGTYVNIIARCLGFGFSCFKPLCGAMLMRLVFGVLCVCSLGLLWIGLFAYRWLMLGIGAVIAYFAAFIVGCCWWYSLFGFSGRLYCLRLL